MGKLWDLIESIPDLCSPLYFVVCGSYLRDVSLQQSVWFHCVNINFVYVAGVCE